jgi:transposase
MLLADPVLEELNRQVGELEGQIQCWHRENDASRKLAQIPGIGPITASALVASISDAKCFRERPPARRMARMGAPTIFHQRQPDAPGTLCDINA